MLIPDFYKIIEFETSQNQVNAVIGLNANHEVYKGHFPGNPVVPGVIQLQIIKELLEKDLNVQLLMTELVFAKYLRLIVPNETPSLQLEIKLKEKKGEIFTFTAGIRKLDLIFTKIKGSFVIT